MLLAECCVEARELGREPLHSGQKWRTRSCEGLLVAVITRGTTTAAEHVLQQPQHSNKIKIFMRGRKKEGRKREEKARGQRCGRGEHSANNRMTSTGSSSTTDYARREEEELKALLTERGLPTDGQKAQLVARIEEDDAVPHDLDTLENKVRERSSNDAFWVWRKGCDREKKACEVKARAQETMNREVAELEARLVEARQRAETVRVEHEQALSRRARVCETMYEALSSRLKFPDGLPSDVAASIQGHARRARRRAAVVSQGWKAWVALAKSRGCSGSKCWRWALVRI